jgi:hypothetical protein
MFPINVRKPAFWGRPLRLFMRGRKPRLHVKVNAARTSACATVLLLSSALGVNAATYYVTIAGLGGEPEYEQRFQGWAHDIDRLLKASGSDAKVTTLTAEQATKAQLDAALRQIAKEATKDDALVLMIIGHGSFDGTDYS